MKILFLFCLSLCPTLQVYACSCIFIETFCETITHTDPSISPDYLIMYGQVSGREEGFMTVEVLDVLFGMAHGDEVKVRDGNGADCLAANAIFSPGDQYLFALWPLEQDAMYGLFICGVTYLRVESGMVRGKIAPGIDQYPLTDIYQLEGCGALQPSEGQLRIFPNPAWGILHISGDAVSEERLGYTFLDMTGKRILHQTVEVSGAFNLEIPVDHLSAGAYIMELQLEGIRKLEKVLILPSR